MPPYLGVKGQQIVVVVLVEADKELAKVDHGVVQGVDEGWLDCGAGLVSCALTEQSGDGFTFVKQVGHV